MSNSNICRDNADPGSELNWAALIEEARSGCRESFNLIARECWNYLAVAARECLSPAMRGKCAPSDLVQQTLTVGYANFAHFDGQSERDLLAWLHRILQNQAMAEVRKYRGTKSRDLRREIPFDQVEPPGDPRATTGSEILIAEDERSEFLQCFEQLPEHYRQILILRSLEGATYESIGKTTGRSADAARKLWLAAVRLLKTSMSPANAKSPLTPEDPASSA